MDRYECDCCGACCQGHLIVEAYQLDVLREPRLAQAEPVRAHLSIQEVLDDLGDEYRWVTVRLPLFAVASPLGGRSIAASGPCAVPSLALSWQHDE